jgi:hypothetical protein
MMFPTPTRPGCLDEAGLVLYLASTSPQQDMRPCDTMVGRDANLVLNSRMRRDYRPPFSPPVSTSRKSVAFAAPSLEA